MKLSNHFKYKEEKITRKLPEFFEKQDLKLFKKEIKKIIPITYLKFLDKYFVSPNGVLFKNIFINTDQFNIPIGLKQKFKIFINMVLSFLKIKKVSSLKNIIFVTNANSHNFFHWFLDVLPKLEKLRQNKEGIFKNENVIFIPNGHKAQFIKDSLEAFDIKIYKQQQKELIFIKNLVLIPDIAGSTGNYRRDLVFHLRQTLRTFWLNKYKDKKIIKRIFVTRKNNNYRKIVNEEEIYPILQNKGFFILDFDILSFENQIKHMLNCEVLISLHGAALTHMLWMKEGSQVLEIREKKDSHNNCYFSLASDLNHKYHYAFVEKRNHKQKVGTKEFLIDTKHFLSRFIRLFD